LGIEEPAFFGIVTNIWLVLKVMTVVVVRLLVVYHALGVVFQVAPNPRSTVRRGADGLKRTPIVALPPLPWSWRLRATVWACCHATIRLWGSYSRRALVVMCVPKRQRWLNFTKHVSGWPLATGRERCLQFVTLILRVLRCFRTLRPWLEPQVQRMMLVGNTVLRSLLLSRAYRLGLVI
jgi:hypothetical protein